MWPMLFHIHWPGLDTWTHPTIGRLDNVNVCGLTSRCQASITSSYHSCLILLSCFCIFSSYLQVLSRLSTLHAPLKLLSAGEGSFVFFLSLTGLGAVFGLLPTCTTHLCLLPTFLATGVFSTLRQAGFEAYDILRELGRAGKISQMLVILKSLRFGGDPLQKQPSCQRSCLFEPFLLVISCLVYLQHLAVRSM